MVKPKFKLGDRVYSPDIYYDDTIHDFIIMRIVITEKGVFYGRTQESGMQMMQYSSGREEFPEDRIFYDIEDAFKLMEREMYIETSNRVHQIRKNSEPKGDN